MKSPANPTLPVLGHFVVETVLRWVGFGARYVVVKAATLGQARLLATDEPADPRPTQWRHLFADEDGPSVWPRSTVNLLGLVVVAPLLILWAWWTHR